ncbi:MAG: hypothetical protein ABFC34_03535, partial [Methanobacterium sp.]
SGDMMERIDRAGLFEPLLENVFSDDKSFYNFYKAIKDSIENGEEIYLSEPLGVSINITNIIKGENAKDLIDSLNDNENFISKRQIIDDMDSRLFAEKKAYSFTRYKFKYAHELNTGLKDHGGKIIKLYLFVSIAETNIDHHIISYVFTTWNELEYIDNIADSYAQLSNRQIIKLISVNSYEIEKLVASN